MTSQFIYHYHELYGKDLSHIDDLADIMNHEIYDNKRDIEEIKEEIKKELETFI